MEHSKKTAFVNRKSELEFLQKWLVEEPEYLLFLYGPKSSGKTTLLNHLINERLDEKKFEIKSLNLREMLIVNYSDFIQGMFGVDHGKESPKKEMKKKREFSVKIFKLTTETLKSIRQKELDPFEAMKKELIKLNEKGKKPVIIVDELQALEGIYMNGQRELIKELFNFFVSMTKEAHLCHVIIASSDGFFIDVIYQDSKLRKTSDFFLVDYLPKEDVIYWLKHLEKESAITQYQLSEEQMEATWETFGGSPSEISRLLGDLLRVTKDGKVSEEDFQKMLRPKLIAARSLWSEYADLYPHKQKLLREIHQQFQKNSLFGKKDLNSLIEDKTFEVDSLKQELKELVKNNFLSFDPVTAEYALQGNSVEHGLSMYLQLLDNLEEKSHPS